MSLVVAAGSAYAFDLFDAATDATDPSSVVAEAKASVAESATLRTDLTTEVEDARTVLTSPDGKAAEKAERQALKVAINDAEDVVTSLGSVASSPSGTVDEANAVLELAGTLHDDAAAVTTALREATQAVVVSGRQVRLERVVSELAAARTALQTAVTDGEQAYAESAGAAEASDRDGLRAALDEAGDLGARADGLLEKATAARAAAGTQADPSQADGSRASAAPQAGAAPRTDVVADLHGKAERLVTAISEATAQIRDATAVVVAETTEGIEADGTDPATGDTGADPAGATAAGATDTTTPAGTCPEPDQVWSAENGHLSSSELAQIPFASGHYVRADVVGGLAQLNDAYLAEFGVNLTINSSYRTYAQQEALYDPSSDTAAPPGCSNHGTGLAIDIGGGVQTFGSAQYEWLKANAEAYGWVHPPFAEPTGRNPEPWHWQSVQAPNSY